MDNSSDHFDDQTQVMATAAAEIQASLAPEFPSFWKLMKPSHVSKGFWLVSPAEFLIMLVNYGVPNLFVLI